MSFNNWYWRGDSVVRYWVKQNEEEWIWLRVKQEEEKETIGTEEKKIKGIQDIEERLNENIDMGQAESRG